MSFEQKDKYGLEDLIKITEMLRDPVNGCPWDLEQNHKSIRTNFIEEVYEACDAIDKDDDTGLCEELGDCLFQVIFHARIAEERGAFGISEIADGVSKKLIYRHPHIFADTKVNGSGEVLENWDKLKKLEKGQKKLADELDAVPNALPALMRSQKIAKRAMKHGSDGFVSEDRKEMLDSVEASFREWKRSPEAGEKLGRLLLAVCGAAQVFSLDSEECLTTETDKYVRERKNKSEEAE